MDCPESEKKRYNFTCPNCLYEQSAAPCIGMEMGVNSGHGSCMNCGAFLHLMIVPDLDGHEMKAILFDDYMSKKKVMIEHRPEFKGINVKS